MPWRVSGVVEERTKFLLAWQLWVETGEKTMTEVCAEFGISRQAGYKLRQRFAAGQWTAAEQGSRAPRRHPNQTAAEVEERVLELRSEHTRWGPRKLKRVLEREDPQQRWPAASTMGEMLRRAGLTAPRGRRRSTPPYRDPLQHADAANRVWCCDFKGWFRTGDGERIDPLTLSDAHSRYLLRCQAVDHTDTARVQAVLESAFREYGLADALRTDNGPPFASSAVAGLSQLAVWLMKLGVRPERIQPGHPEQNGRHERMHRTLKQETATPPAPNRRAQQRAFDHFRQEYNEQRPHQALGLETPASVYRPSPRAMPARVPQPEYDSDLLVRRVHQHGGISWKHSDVFLSEVLRGEWVGLKPIHEPEYLVYFAAFPIAVFDSARRKMRPLQSDEGCATDGAGEGVSPSPAPHPPTKAARKVSTMCPV